MTAQDAHSHNPRPQLAPWAFAIVLSLLPCALLLANRGAVLLLALLFLASLADRLRGVRWVMPDRILLAAAALVLALGAASALWEHTAGLALGRAGQLAGLMIGGWVALAGLGGLDRVWARRLMIAALSGLAVFSLVIVSEALDGQALARALPRLIGGPEPRPGEWLMPRYKAAAAVGSILLLILLGHGLATRRWWLALVAALMAVITAKMTGSLAGLAALAVAGLVGLGCLKAPRHTALAVRLGLAAVFLLAPLIAWAPPSRSLVDQLPPLPHSAMHRLEIWRFAAERAMERPLLGWGLDGSRELPGGDGKVETWVIHTDPWPVKLEQQALPLHPHNFVLQVWVELGLAGTLAVLAVLLRLIGLAAGLPRHQGPVALAALTAALVVGGVAFGAWQSWWLATLWLAAALTRVLRADQASVDSIDRSNATKS